MEKELDLTKFVPIKNPLSSERSHLRRSLIPGALITCKSNLRYLEKVTIFEVGSVFHPRKMQNLPDEPRSLSLLLSGARESKSWLEKSENIYIATSTFSHIHHLIYGQGSRKDVKRCNFLGLCIPRTSRKRNTQNDFFAQISGSSLSYLHKFLVPNKSTFNHPLKKPRGGVDRHTASGPLVWENGRKFTSQQF